MASENFYIKDSIELLFPSFYQKVIKREKYLIVISIFKDSDYNYIIPLVKSNLFDKGSVETDLKVWRDKGYGFVYYIDKKLAESYEATDIISSVKLYDDLYVFQHISQVYEIKENYKIIKMGYENYDKFLDLSEKCFPEWNNKDFMLWCLKNKYVNTLGVVIDNRMVAFGSVFVKHNSEYVLIMNSATHPDFRRKGLHDYLIRYRINEILKRKKHLCVYANVEEKGASYLGFLKLGFLGGPHYFLYKEGVF